MFALRKFDASIDQLAHNVDKGSVAGMKHAHNVWGG